MKKTIEDIKKEFKVEEVWSWSRYKTYSNDKYMYYLKYVQSALEDMPNSRYGKMGNISHDILENWYNGKIKYCDMPKMFEAGIFEVDLLNLKYDRTNSDKNRKIALKYEESIKLFFKNHIKIANAVKTEVYFLTMVGTHLFQGYIDAMHKEGDSCVITDWKTSTIYTGKKLEEEAGQLLIYAIAINNLGFNPDKIKIRWNFLKYVTADVPLKNGNTRTSNIVRNELGKSLQVNVAMWLKDSKYSKDEIDEYIKTLIKSNSLEHLPQDIKDKYTLRDCYVYVDCSQDALESFKNTIASTLNEADELKNKYNETKDKNIWWQDINDDYSYFMANLSGYSARFHEPYAKYLDDLKTKDDELNQMTSSFLESELSKMFE